MQEDRRSTRFGSLALLLATAVALSACGESGSTTGSSSVVTTTPPPAPVKTVVTEGSIDSLPMNFASGRYFSTSATGTIDLTVDWTYTEDTIYVWLAKGQCTFEQFDAGTCNFLTSSLTRGAKPRLLSVPSAAAGTYTLIIGNLGPRDEAAAYQVVLTSVSGASMSTRDLSSSQLPGFLGALPGRLVGEAHGADEDGRMPPL